LILQRSISQSDWEASSDEEKSTAPVSAPVAPPKKKGTLKQKLAEKEAARQAMRAAGGDSPVDYDEDAVLDPRAKARLEKERELESDLRNATELFGSATIKGG
jgi:translation initiation factor 3 subunit J